MMGRKNHRVEQIKLPAPNPPAVTRPAPPAPRQARKTDACRFANCKRIANIYLYEGGICEQHADSIWERVEMRDATKRHEDVPGMESRDYIRGDARKIRATERRKPTSVGQIYYVLVDGLIKVGWTTQLANRIRSYGPKAVLLANYDGTRADEAALHRQLAPSRFKGREWYSDTPILRAFIDEAITKHGPPRFDSIGWTEPKDVVAGKRTAKKW